MSAADARRARVRELIGVFNDHRERWLEALPEDIVVVTDPRWPGGGSFEGRERLGGFMDQFEEAWESVRFELGDLEEVGGALISSARWVTRGSASGAETAMSFSVVWLFAESDELREVRFFFDAEEARAFIAGEADDAGPDDA